MAQFKTMYDEELIPLQSFRSKSSIWTEKSLKDERNLEKSEDLPGKQHVQRVGGGSENRESEEG